MAFIAFPVSPTRFTRDRNGRDPVLVSYSCTDSPAAIESIPGSKALHSIASGLGTEWALLFSINPDLPHFSVLPSGLRLKTGLRYRAVKGDSVESLGVRFGIMLEHIFRANPEARDRALVPGDDVCLAPALATADGCPPQAKSSTWEPIEEQYVPPDYWDNPFNWEAIEYDTDPRGLPTKRPNPLYPQRPAVS